MIDLTLNIKSMQKSFKKLSIYSVLRIILIACGQSVAVKCRKTEKYVRNYILCAYCLLIIAALIITLFYCEYCQSLGINSIYLIMINSLYAYSVVNNIIFYDDFEIELDNIIRIKENLKNTPKTDLCLIVQVAIITFINFSIVIFNVYVFFRTSFLISAIVFMMFYFLFLKIIILINEFTIIVKALNRLTEETIDSKLCIRDICLLYTSLETRVPKINKTLDPMLLPTLLMNFMKIFIQPYLSTIQVNGTKFDLSWSMTTNLLCITELVKLYAISDVCGKLGSEFAKWWDLVESSGSSLDLNEMNNRGIKPYQEKRVSIKLYNMFVIDSNYIKVVLLATLNYAFFMIQQGK